MPHNKAQTFSDDTDAFSIEIDTSSRRGRWGFAGLMIAFVGIVFLFTGSLCRAQDYATPLDIEYGLVDVSGMAVDSADNLYVLIDRLCAVNVYTADGAFQYSIKVPDYPNGGNEIYMLDDVLNIQDKNGDIYAYQNGVYRGRAAYADSDEDTVTINVYDENNRQHYSLAFLPDGNFYSLLLLDGSSVYIKRQDDDESSVLIYENGRLTDEYPYSETDFFTEVIAQDSKGSIFSTSFGPQLTKITSSGEEVVIASTSWLEWFWRAPLVSFAIIITGFITAMMSRLIPKKGKE